MASRSRTKGLKRKPRKPRPGEVVCRCSKYGFPHRFTGGKCDGQHVVDEYWEGHYGGGECKDCNMQDATDEGNADCHVVNKAEEVTECPVFCSFCLKHEVRLYGPRWYGKSYG